MRDLGLANGIWGAKKGYTEKPGNKLVFLRDIAAGIECERLEDEGDSPHKGGSGPKSPVLKKGSLSIVPVI